MEDKTLNELAKQRQDLVRELDKIGMENDTGLNSALELVNSKIKKRQKELQLDTAGIAIEETPVVKEKKQTLGNMVKEHMGNMNAKEFAEKFDKPINSVRWYYNKFGVKNVKKS